MDDAADGARAAAAARKAADLARRREKYRQKSATGREAAREAARAARQVREAAQHEALRAEKERLLQAELVHLSVFPRLTALTRAELLPAAAGALNIRRNISIIGELEAQRGDSATLIRQKEKARKTLEERALASGEFPTKGQNDGLRIGGGEAGA